MFAKIQGTPLWSVVLDGVNGGKSALYLSVKMNWLVLRMRSAYSREFVAAHPATMELSVKHAVLLSSGPQTAARCVRATLMDTVIPSLESVHATPPTGVPFARTPADAKATATAILSMETASATKAGGPRPAPNSASASLVDPWTPAVTH